MIETGLEGIIAPLEGEGFDSENPTEQTELLSLSVRALLSHLSGELITVRQSNSDDSAGVSEIYDELSNVLFNGVQFAEDCRAAKDADEPLPEVEASDFSPSTVVSLVAPLLPAIISGSVSLAPVVAMILPTVIRFIVTTMVNRMLDPTQDMSEVIAAINGVKDAVNLNTEQITAGYNNMCDWIASLQETKQVGIMSTTEIDKVIWSKTI